MTRPFPILSTLTVIIAVGIMIALGVWQLQRKDEKEALLALFAANEGKPAMAFPVSGPVPNEAMFRTSSISCLNVVSWRTGSGRDVTGKAGITYFAQCRTGAEGPGFLASMGVSDRPNIKPDWKGGPLTGMIVTEPSRSSLIAKMFGTAPVLGPMLVSETPLPGMRAVAKPDPDDVPNNHLAYAVQWFLFAGSALIIYMLALWKRQAKA